MTEMLQHWTPLATIAVLIVGGLMGAVNVLIIKGDYADAFKILAKVWALQTLLTAHEKRLKALERKPDETPRVQT